MLSHFSHVWIFVTPQAVDTRLLSPWGFPGKNTGVGCHFLLQEIFQIHKLNLQLLCLLHLFFTYSLKLMNLLLNFITIVEFGCFAYTLYVNILNRRDHCDLWFMIRSLSQVLSILVLPTLPFFLTTFSVLKGNTSLPSLCFCLSLYHLMPLPVYTTFDTNWFLCLGLVDIMSMYWLHIANCPSLWNQVNLAELTLYQRGAEGKTCDREGE